MIIKNANFNIVQIADSGQCFRMMRLGSSDQVKYGLVAFGRYLEMVQLDGDTVEMSCEEEEFHELWKDYFDLTYDYRTIVEELLHGEDQFLRKAADYGRGIRILKQEPFEAMISFIISQNKNIPAIKNCIEAICERYGERKTTTDGIIYYTFPGAEILSNANKEELRALKLGYRDEYIIRASKAVAEGELSLDELMGRSFEEAVKALKQVHGIGEKVANCIALYGLHHIEGFPVDVWISRVINEIYEGQFDKNKYQGYAGIVQQYMFYYMRYLKGVN